MYMAMRSIPYVISAETRLELDPAHLLKVSELGDLHPVEPHLPPQPHAPKRGRLPVILDKADVVIFGSMPEAAGSRGRSRGRRRGKA